MTESPTFLLDVNVLIALTNPDHADHARAHRWFGGVGTWATTPLTESAFVRLMMNPVVSRQQLPRPVVLAALSALRALPGHVFLADDSSLADTAIDLVGVLGHRQVADAHLVNLAAQHGAVLATLDEAIEHMLVPADRRWVHLI